MTTLFEQQGGQYELQGDYRLQNKAVKTYTIVLGAIPRHFVCRWPAAEEE